MPAKNNIARICVLSSYIKRRSNLCLMSEKESFLDNRELQLCLQESLENLKLCNIACALNCRCCGKSSSADLIALYDAMQSVFEQILFRTRALLIKAELNSSCISVRIQIDPITLEKPLNTCSFLKLGGTVEHQKSTDACRITFKIGDKTA